VYVSQTPIRNRNRSIYRMDVFARKISFGTRPGIDEKRLYLLFLNVDICNGKVIS
jgi:hypothetical protein